jgi:competence protein ComEC
MALLIAASAAAFYYFLASFPCSIIQSAMFFICGITAISLCQAVLTIHRNSRRLRIISAVTYALCIGAVIGFTAGFPRPTRLGMVQERISALYGTIRSDPRALARGGGKLSFALKQSIGFDGTRVSAQGQVEVLFPAQSISSLKQFGRGAQAFIEGGFIDGRDGLFIAEAIHLNMPASALNQMRTRIRMQLVERFSGSSWGGLSLALILGVKDAVDTQLSENYRKAGSSHVLALSGMHLSLIIALLSLLLKRVLGLKLSAVLGAFFIVCYVYLVGDLPSLNRAAITYVLVTYAIVNLLPKRPSIFLAMSFLIQIILEPKTGMSISFILSYSALAGILLFGPALCNLIKGPVPAKIIAPLSASVGAFIATAAITAGVFGVLYPVGIVAGLVVVPLTEVFIIFSFVFLVLSPFPALANLVSLLMELLYRCLESTVSFFAQAPGIPVQSTPLVIAITGVLGAGILLLNAAKRNSEN